MNNNSGLFGFAVLPTPTIFINNDVIPQGEIKSITDLVNPKYKGKITIASFDRAAQGSLSMTALYLMHGEDFIRKLAEDQEPAFTFDTRQIVEWWASGKYPIIIGPGTANVRQFTEQGVVKKFTKLEPEVYTATNPSTIQVLKNPPHPNAAKVFIDWFLSKEGQTAFVQNTKDFVSRRKDVAPAKGFSGFEKIDLTRSQFDAEGLKATEWILNYGKKVISSAPAPTK